MLIKTPPDEARHRERRRQVTEGLNGLQFTKGHGGETGVHMKGDRVRSTRLTMGESGELLAISEEKFNLEAGFVIPVKGDGVQVQIGAKQEGDPLGPRVNDDHDSDAPAQAGEIDEGGFEPERRVR